MKTTIAKAALRGAVCVSAIALMSATSAFAQADTAAQASEAEDSADIIIVTGSRIARPNETSAIPITSVTKDELISNSKVSIGDTLNDLPSLRTSYGQGQNSSGLGVSGLNLLDLRGIGAQRTLVLVNGRRHVGADILVNGVSVDINTIPTDLVDRVDIVTGANSAVYGSDAISGVVNFVMKTSFEGLKVSGQAGISDKGDAGQYRLTATAGTNFADGRGNVAVSAEYTRQSPFYASQRKNLRSQTALITVDSDPASATNGSDGVPDRKYFDDVRSVTIAPGGLSNFATRQCGQDSLGAFYECTFLYQPDGTLIPQTGTRVGLAPNGNMLGGNGSNSREGQNVGLITKNDRMGINLIGKYEFSPAVTAFWEGKYYRTKTLSVGAGPAFFQGTTLSVFGGDTRERPRLDNPYLSAQAKSLITQQMTTVAGLTGGALPTDASRFNLRINLVDLGMRQEAATRETFRLVGGFKGDLTDHLRYEVSANYGKFKEATKVLGNINVQRLLLSIDAARDNGGNIVCRSKFDAAAAKALAGNDAATARLAADVAACVPVNLFGSGNVTAAARNYIVQDTIARGSISQFDLQGFVTGDTGGFFNLPGGPVGFALGAEYRRETNTFKQDQLIEDGMTFYNSLAPFRSKPFEVKEVYGEVRLPLLKDIPMIHELTLSANGRISDYTGSAGTTYTYNLSAEYAPISALRLRGSWGRSVRAPNLSELYSQQSADFAGGFTDPCSDRNIGAGTQYRSANCASDGRPAGYDYVYTASLGYVTGGNPGLKPEKSDSLTLGGVFTPEFIPGLALSVDYYDIKVKDVILTLGGQTIVNQCYDSPTLNNSFCAQFSRNKTSSTLATGEEPFRIIEGSLLSSGVNFAKLKVRGYDVDLNYRRSFGNVDFSAHLVWTHVLQNYAFTNPSDPARANDGRGENGDPVDSFNWNVGLGLGKFKLDYQLRYIGKQAVQGNAIENVQATQGRPPENADWAEVLFWKPVFYHNVKLGLDVNEKFNFYLGVDNLFDKRPPYNQTGSGGSTTGAASRIYDTRGRYLYAGFVANF